jgi:disulfide bond formation protein DsbB
MLSRRVDTVKTLAYRWASLTLLAALAGIGIALGFQYLGGVEPCPLCLQQRYAYYAGIPVLFIGLALMSADRNRTAALLFLLVGFAFLANAALGTYHAGAEWKFWPGPDTCAGSAPMGSGGGTLIERLKNTRVIRCDEASGRFFGLSFAGWNVILSLALCIGALQAAFSTKLSTSRNR